MIASLSNGTTQSFSPNMSKKPGNFLNYMYLMFQFSFSGKTNLF